MSGKGWRSLLAAVAALGIICGGAMMANSRPTSSASGTAHGTASHAPPAPPAGTPPAAPDDGPVVPAEMPVMMVGHPVVEIADFGRLPYSSAGQAGQRPGLAVEVLHVCVPRAGFTPVFRHDEPDRLKADLRSGALDIAISRHEPDREDYLVYGVERLFQEAFRPFVRANSVTDVRTIADFDHLKVGYHLDRTTPGWFRDYLEERERAGKLTVLPDIPATIKALIQGKIDVFVAPRDETLWLAKVTGQFDKLRVGDFDVHTADDFVTVARASPRINDRQAFLAAVDKCIHEMKADGTYDRLRAHYGME